MDEQYEKLMLDRILQRLGVKDIPELLNEKREILKNKIKSSKIKSDEFKPENFEDIERAPEYIKTFFEGENRKLYEKKYKKSYEDHLSKKDETLNRILKKLDIPITGDIKSKRAVIKRKILRSDASSVNTKYHPSSFSYKDENGNVIGYDIDAIKQMRNIYKSEPHTNNGQFGKNAQIYDDFIKELEEKQKGKEEEKPEEGQPPKEEVKAKGGKEELVNIINEPSSEVEQAKEQAKEQSKEEVKEKPGKEEVEQSKEQQEKPGKEEVEQPKEQQEVEQPKEEGQPPKESQAQNEPVNPSELMEEFSDIHQEIVERTNLPLNLRAKVLLIINKFLDGEVLDAWNDIRNLAKFLTYNDIVLAIEMDPKLKALFEDSKGQIILNKIKKKGNQKIYDIKELTGLLQKLVKNKKVATVLSIIIITAAVTISVLSSQLDKYKKKKHEHKHSYKKY